MTATGPFNQETLRVAGCVICDDEERVLLIHRDTPQRKHWEIPGGKPEPGEDAVSAAVREVREELDISVAIDQIIGTATFPEDDYQIEYTWFKARIVGGVPRPVETGKHDACRYFFLNQIRAMIDSHPAGVSSSTQTLLRLLGEGEFTLETVV